MHNLLNPQSFEMLGAYFVFSAFVSGMPDPTPQSGVGYRWVYRSLHVLAGDLSSLVKRPGAAQ